MMNRIINKDPAAKQILVPVLLLCLILMPAFSQTEELTADQVRAAVQTWVRSVTADAQPDAIIEKLEPYQVERETVAYIAHLVNGGFCLCGPDDLVLPVYLYCPQGTYDSQIPDYQYILREIEMRLKNLRKGLEENDPNLLQYQVVLSERASAWQDLIAGRVPPRNESRVRVEPDMMVLDLTSTWHQYSPYNDQCPELTPGVDENVKVGCVATAMSQIMYYWQWPNTGMGSGSTVYYYRWRDNWDEEPLAADPVIPVDNWWIDRLEWDAADGGKLRMNGYWDQSLYDKAKDINEDADYRSALQTLWNRLTSVESHLSANFGATTYDWSIVEDVHDSTDVPDAGDNEVAQICYHAGLAVSMDYGVRLSTTYTIYVDNALMDHFRYDPDAVYASRDIYDMTDEIQWLRPLEISGQKPEGGVGHAWVVFGYNKATDPDRQFKMNLGWGGGSDGWYSCDDINLPGPYTEDQFIIKWIAPLDVVQFVDSLFFDPGDGSPDDPYENIEEAIVEAPDGATLILKAGSVNTFSAATLVIDKPLTLKGYDVVIK